MRYFICALTAAALLGGVAEAKPVKKPAAKAAPSASLPAFTFKDVTAGVTLDPTSVGTCTPDRDGLPGKLQCYAKDNHVAGIVLDSAPTYYFYNGRLSSMLFLFDNDGANFLTLLGAFREKYGKPCSTETEKWQNKAGSTFDNATATWCFKTGKLLLKQLGPSMSYGLVTYDDTLSVPTKNTPSDF